MLLIKGSIYRSNNTKAGKMIKPMNMEASNLAPNRAMNGIDVHVHRKAVSSTKGLPNVRPVYISTAGKK